MKWFTGFLAIVIISVVSCKKSNPASVAPEISLIKITPTTKSLSSEDSLYIYLRISDANSNLGVDTPNYDIYLLDKRSDTVFYTNNFNFPVIPPDLQDASKGFEATCIIALNSSYFQLREDDTSRTQDTLKYEIYMFDRDKNESNHITTPEIILVP